MRTYRKCDAYELAVASRTHKVFEKILRRSRGRYAAAAHFVQSEYNQQIKLYLEGMRDACLEVMYEARRPYGAHPRALTVLSEIVVTQEREIDEFKDVLSTIVELNPEAQEQTGDIYCFFCSSGLEWEDHEPDCPYLLARKLIKDV